MPRRRELRGAAFGLLGSLISRNNDVSGYWALGRLYKHAVKTNAPSVCVDLLDLTITPPSGDFTAMATHFQRMLGAQLSARHLPVDWVRGATICVEFGRMKSPDALGDVFNAVAVITDDKGRAHSATASGACWVHDPAKELRSTRAVESRVIDASAVRRFSLLAAVALATAVALSVLFSVPYVFTAIGFAGWLFIGHLVTIDDDFPGGWSNPDGVHPVPWGPIAMKGLVFLALCVAAISPDVRQWGG